MKIELKECPFCKGKNLKVMDKEFYEGLVAKSGRATVTIECLDCDVTMWETSDLEDYELKMAVLATKWNRRGWEEP